MADTPNIPDIQAQESMWIEIIRHMEFFYAQLAEAQAEAERRAEELGQAKALADNIIASISEGLIALDAAGRITLVNGAAERLLDYPHGELPGLSLESLVPEDSRPAWTWRALRRRLLRQSPLPDEETVWRDRRGREIPVGVSGAALQGERGEAAGAVLVLRDLRETRRLQAQLIQAAKMSSLGRLAAGVAHELNNPLGGILLYADLLMEDTAPDDPRRRNVVRIAEQAVRCRDIVRGLLDFGRPAEPRAARVDVNAVLRNAMSILEGQEMFHNVAVHWSLADPAPCLSGDAGLLGQAFTNIILNAVEALEGTGALTIGSEPGPDGQGALVTIADTGRGMPPQDREHLFEPFFTTKEKGTGLGLSITYGIIERHNGTVEVVSEVGRGTTFRVTLLSMSPEGDDADG